MTRLPQIARGLNSYPDHAAGNLLTGAGRTVTYCREHRSRVSMAGSVLDFALRDWGG